MVSELLKKGNQISSREIEVFNTDQKQAAESFCCQKFFLSAESRDKRVDVLGCHCSSPESGTVESVRRVVSTERGGEAAGREARRGWQTGQMLVRMIPAGSEQGARTETSWVRLSDGVGAERRGRVEVRVAAGGCEGGGGRETEPRER